MLVFKKLFFYFVLYLVLTGFLIILFNIFSPKIKPSVYQSQPIVYEFVLLGSSEYIFGGTDRVFAQYYLNSFLLRHLNCGFYIHGFSPESYRADGYRIWGQKGSKGINQASLIQQTSALVEQIKARGSQPVVVIGYGANESKDIKAGKNWASMLKFKNYLENAVSLFKNKGAIVIVNTPIKGCPTIPSKNYDVEGMLRQISNNIVNWFAGKEITVNLYQAFEQKQYGASQAWCSANLNYAKHCFPDQKQNFACLTECLINLPPNIGPDSAFPNRGCLADYCHPNQKGYELMAEKIGQAFLGLNPCPQTSPSPSPSISPSPSPSPSIFPSPSPSPFSSPSLTPSVSPSPSPFSLPSPVPIPSLKPKPILPTTLNIKIKFSSVPANNNSRNLLFLNRKKRAMVVLQNQKGDYFYQPQTNGFYDFFYQEESQTYQAEIVFPFLPSGKYNILIKGPFHRQTRFCQKKQQPTIKCKRNQYFSLKSGKTYFFDFSAYPLEFGDVNQDGLVNVKDYSWLKACRKIDARLRFGNYTKGCQSADANFDGAVDNTDIDIFYQTLYHQPDDK